MTGHKGQLSIKRTYLKRGQERPYASHTWHAELEFRAESKWDLPGPDQVKALAQTLVHPFTEDPRKPGDMGDHFRPRLTECKLTMKKTGPGAEAPATAIWLVHVEEPFCD